MSFSLDRFTRSSIRGTVVHHPSDVKGNEANGFKYSCSTFTEDSDNVLLSPILSPGEVQDTINNPNLIVTMKIYSDLKRNYR